MSANEEKLTHHQIEQCLDKFNGLDSESSSEDIKKILYESVAGYDPYNSEKVIKFPK
jgi:hypothetical protein